jgi:hypothetical protein
VQQTPVVGQLGIEVITGAAPGAQVVDGQVLDVGDILRIEYQVDAATMRIQGVAFR